MSIKTDTGRYAIAFTAAIGGFMATLELTVINVALVPIAKALNTDLTNVQWVITASFLAVAAVIPVSGYLGHRLGMKRVFLISVTLFTLGSLLCSLSHEIGLLILFRIVQGIGGGAIIPLGQAIALHPFKPEERAKALSIVAFPIMLAPAIGPSLGGFLTEQFSWEAVFLMNLPLGLLCLGLGWRILPADRPEKNEGKAFDLPGLGLSMLGVTLVVYGLNLVAQRDPDSATGALNGWLSGQVWVFLGGGLAVLAVFVVYSLSRPDPVLELRLYQKGDFALSSVIVWLSRAVSYAALLLIPVFLQQVHQPALSVMEAGLFLIPQGLATAVGVIIGMLLYQRLGARCTAVTGTLLLTGASFPLTLLDYNMALPILQVWLILRGLALTVVFMPLNSMALEKLSGVTLAKGTALYNVTMQIFSSLGIALATTLFVQQTNYHAEILSTQGVSPSILGAQAAATGMNDVFLYMTVAGLLVLVPCVFLPGKKKPATTVYRPEGEVA